MNRIETEDAMRLEWKLDGVTPRMIDWFWSNMEKCMILWHPSQHETLEWAKAPEHGNPINSIHIAPQTWADGTRQNLYIQMVDIATLPEQFTKYITYEHVAMVAGIGLGEEALKNPKIMGYRIHQWSSDDCGVAGESLAIGMKKKEDHEAKMVWAAHCEEEISNWEVFLPTIYNLYKVVKNTDYNPYADLSVEKVGDKFQYKYIE